MSPEELDQLNLGFTETWAAEIDLDCEGVNVADVMQYDLMRVLGVIWLRNRLATEVAHE